MSHSAIDATRFTATSPHAYTKPTSINRAAAAPPSTSSASNTTPGPNPPNARFVPKAPPPPPPVDPKKANAPPGETPAEKVARLRLARLKEREAQSSRWDRLVLRGRVWADKAHKITVFSLLGFSVVSIVITGFALTDMIMHNRRRRSAFYAEQHAIYGQRLLEAIEAEKSGRPLDEDQAVVINRERARVMAEEAKKERSWRKEIKNFVMGGLKMDDGDGEGRGVPEQVLPEVPSEGEILERLGVHPGTILERAIATEKRGAGSQTDKDVEGDRGGEGGTMEGSRILQAVAEKRREGESVAEAAGVVGGPLDQMAEGAVQAIGGKIHAAEEKVGSSGGGWTSWWSRK